MIELIIAWLIMQNIVGATFGLGMGFMYYEDKIVTIKEVIKKLPLIVLIGVLIMPLGMVSIYVFYRVIMFIVRLNNKISAKINERDKTRW